MYESSDDFTIEEFTMLFTNPGRKIPKRPSLLVRNENGIKTLPRELTFPAALIKRKRQPMFAATARTTRVRTLKQTFEVIDGSGDSVLSVFYVDRGEKKKSTNTITRHFPTVHHR